MPKPASARGPVCVSDPDFQAQSSLNTTAKHSARDTLGMLFAAPPFACTHVTAFHSVDAPAAFLYPAAKPAQVFLPSPYPSLPAAHFYLCTAVCLFCDCTIKFCCWEEYTELHPQPNGKKRSASRSIWSDYANRLPSMNSLPPTSC